MHPLITPQALAARLDDPDWIVFDCRHAPAGAPPGRATHDQGPGAYAAGHIPGARYADLERDLAGPIGAGTGRHPLPDWNAFCAWLGRQGVGNDSTVVVYDASSGAWAARLWWMLCALGHARVAVLDGGFARWQREGHPVTTDAPRIEPATFTGRPEAAQQATLEEVQAHLGDPGLLLVDARAPERYRGETEPIDPRAGHIPGAVNLPFAGNVDAEGVFLPPERLRERLLRAYGGRPPETTVHYCGSGVTACHNLLAQAATGLPPGRLYAGSWSQWCADPQRPAEQGEAEPRSATGD